MKNLWSLFASAGAAPLLKSVGDKKCEDLTPDKVAFIEGKTKENFDFTISCYDQVRAEGNNVLQWLFGVIVGSIGLLGTVAKDGHFCLAVGCAVALAWAAWSAARLIHSLRSQDICPPGNYFESLNSMIDEPEHRMRWRESRGIDSRIRDNLETVKVMAVAVDKARGALVWLPLAFVGGIALGFLLKVHAAPLFPLLAPAWR